MPAGRLSIAIAMAALLMPIGGAHAQDTLDEAMTVRFPDSTLVGEDRKNYDARSFALGMKPKSSAEDRLDLEGKVATARYETAATASPLEILRSLQRAFRAQGYETRFECTDRCNTLGVWLGKQGLRTPSNGWRTLRTVTMEREAQGQRTMVAVAASTLDDVSSYAVLALSTEAEVAQAEVQSAEKIASAISADGAAAIYGLEFETGKAELLPAAEPALTQMAGFLMADPEVSILLVGHTDNEGTFDYNLDLSERRARAVRQALIDRHGIGAGRLTSIGVSFAAPKAPNTSEEGRARNRRVEMVPR